MVPLHPPVPPHLSVAETLEQAGSWNRPKWAVVQTETEYVQEQLTLNTA